MSRRWFRILVMLFLMATFLPIAPKSNVIAAPTMGIHDPFGSFDGWYRVPGGIRVRGWAIDPNVIEPVQVHVYVDSSFIVSLRAQDWRPDVGADFPGSGPYHGFDDFVPIKHRPPGWLSQIRTVCIYAINKGAGSVNTKLGCVTVVYKDVPFGHVDSWTPTDCGESVCASMRIAGWTIDPDEFSSTDVHVYRHNLDDHGKRIDNIFLGSFRADRARTDVGSVNPGYGNNHGFVFTVPIETRNDIYDICVYAINIGPRVTGTNPILACNLVRSPIRVNQGGASGSAGVRGISLSSSYLFMEKGETASVKVKRRLLSGKELRISIARSGSNSSLPSGIRSNAPFTMPANVEESTLTFTVSETAREGEVSIQVTATDNENNKYTAALDLRISP